MKTKLSQLNETQKRNYRTFRRRVRREYPGSIAFGSFQISQHARDMFSAAAFNRDGKMLADWNL